MKKLALVCLTAFALSAVAFADDTTTTTEKKMDTSEATKMDTKADGKTGKMNHKKQSHHKMKDAAGNTSETTTTTEKKTDGNMGAGTTTTPNDANTAH